MGSIALLATDAATRKAAETKLILENKLRPTEEERAAKLAELASDALARREANRERLACAEAHPGPVAPSPPICDRRLDFNASIHWPRMENNAVRRQ